jgi:hypothetical protein
MASSKRPAPINRSRHVRCRLCGIVLPGWLLVPNEPDGAMLLNHLVARHPVEAKPLLHRTETECINTVAMEMFERVPGHRAGEEQR